MEQAVAGDAGIVDQHVDGARAGPRRRRLDGGGAVVERADVALDHHTPRPVRTAQASAASSLPE